MRGPVKILGDTGALEFYITASILPISSETNRGKTVLFQGMGMRVNTAPSSGCCCSLIYPRGMSPMPGLPISGVAAILESYLVGVQVWPDVPPALLVQR